MKVWFGSEDCVYLMLTLSRLSEAASAKSSRKHLARLADKVKPAGRYVDLKQSEILYLKALLHDAQTALEKVTKESGAQTEAVERLLLIRATVDRVMGRLERTNA